ncbi:hypothetical protein FEM08_25040 [Flavobacterium gilvum]|nr:hypothetical protein FEM08_25040 [Flavobacterium gilvum]
MYFLQVTNVTKNNLYFNQKGLNLTKVEIYEKDVSPNKLLILINDIKVSL